jgi:replicative DNA helicase
VKRIARELNIPVIVLSQLSRDVEQRKGKPRLSDLRESGAIEQDADEVWFIHFPDDDECEPQRRCELLRAKARNGAVGKIEMVFLKKWTRFESAAKIEDKDMPQGG